jgi:MinD-like ATPase involved in chromosome partitioning or flagellar assembly
MTTGVLCAIRGPREPSIVAALDARISALRVVRRCADLAELLAAATAGLGRVAVLSANLPELDREAVARLRGAGAAVLAIVDAHSDWQAERMDALGAARVVPDDRTPDEIADIVEDLARDLASGRPLGAPASHPTSSPEPSPDRAEPPSGRGQLVAVWGPTGAPGRSTIAVNLAAELVALGKVALLVDADTYGSSLAMTLGLLDESAGIASVARLAGSGGLAPELVLRQATQLSSGFHLLTGLNRAERWPELTPSALDLVWEAARRVVDWVIVDCGFCLEGEAGAEYSGMAARRNAITLGVLRAADVVIAVGSGDPVGIARLVRALADVSDRELMRAGAQPVVVVNRVRASAVGARANDAVREALARFAGIEEPVLVPDDRAACDGALLAGRTLREHASGSPARQAIAALAERLALEATQPSARVDGAARRRRAHMLARR